MQNFADQCLDMARSILSHNLSSINEDGSIAPVEGEASIYKEPGHAALAIGEYHRATGETELDGYDLIDLAARCITAQAFTEESGDNGLAYGALGLLSFGPAKDRNPVWERLLEPTREILDRRLLTRSEEDSRLQAFNIAKSVARYSMGLSKKDETGKLIDKFIENIKQTSSAGFYDDDTKNSCGKFDIYGVLSFVFIRQSLQLHGNLHLKERKLPTLRTHAEKYLKMLPDLVRQDGLGWAYGRGIGAYGQMHCISLLMQSMRDNWIPENKKSVYYDILRKLFHFFFATYLDQEHGYLVIRDEERTTVDTHTTRMANFDAARYLSQWSRLARTINEPLTAQNGTAKTGGKFVFFDKNHRKEQGVFLYQDAQSGLHLQLPLVNGGEETTADYLAFPHSPGIFDWPANKYLPVMLPELKFGDNTFIPAFYGKRCVTGIGMRNSFYFRYEQPELINTEGKIVSGIGSCKVNWTFSGNKITSEFIFTVKNQIQLDQMRYILALGQPHTNYSVNTSFRLGEEGLRANVLKDDFQATWADTESVSDDPEYRSYHGKIHYLQTLKREHPLIMRPGQQYRLTLSFEPDVAFIGE